jgi:hypothetical protein
MAMRLPNFVLDDCRRRVRTDVRTSVSGIPASRDSADQGHPGNGRPAACGRLSRERVSPGRRPPRRGVVLLIVLFVVVVLALSAYTFTELMLTHYEGTRHNARTIQARFLVDSALERIKVLLMYDEMTRLDSGGLFNNPMMFQGVNVVPDMDPAERASFTVLSPLVNPMGLPEGMRYGLEDESARLNLHLLLVADRLVENGGRILLMTLPGMTEDTADAIMDWMDADSEPREMGAEMEYYGMLQPPYMPKNAPLDTVEELLLVRGVFPELLFGYDTNRNGVLDFHEQQQGGIQGMMGDPDMAIMVRGWSPFLTLYSAEKNRNMMGMPRVFLNQDDMEMLYSELLEVVDEEWARFIVAYRQFGPFSGNDQNPEELAAGEFTGELDLSQPGQTQIPQILDLVGARVQVGGQQGGILESPFANDILAMNVYFPELLDNCTVNPETSIPGRININQAPRSLMLGIPGMTEELVDMIIETRGFPEERQLENPNFRFETWLLTEGLLITEDGTPDIATMKQLVPFINAGGDVYRAQIVGYYQGFGASARVEVVIDGSGMAPRVLFWRDLSHLGRGYPLEVLGIDMTGQL